MVKQYRVTTTTRIVNWLMTTLIRLGFGPDKMHLLTVTGRRSGRPYSTPVSLVQQDVQRYLVSPYGEVNWVRNARAAGTVTITRGKNTETLMIEELDAEASGPILKQYIASEAITRPYFDAGPDSPVEDFAREAHRHPVFRLNSA
jgi:deazaflavin-dependent oxidoreductase (nitroreductase family)